MNRSLSHPLHSSSSSSSSSSTSPLSIRFFLQLNGEVFNLIIDSLFGKWNLGSIFWSRVRISAVGAQKRYSGLPILIFPFMPKQIILWFLTIIFLSLIFSVLVLRVLDCCLLLWIFIYYTQTLTVDYSHGTWSSVVFKTFPTPPSTTRTPDIF